MSESVEGSRFDRHYAESVLFGGRRPMFIFDVLPFVGVVFSLIPPLWELCCSLVPPIDGTRPGNIFGGGGVFRGNIFKSRFLHYSFPPLASSISYAEIIPKRRN